MERIQHFSKFRQNFVKFVAKNHRFGDKQQHLRKIGELLEKCKINFDENVEIRERCKRALCRSRRELSNEYLLAKFGLDTAENEQSPLTLQRFNFGRALASRAGVGAPVLDLLGGPRRTAQAQRPHGLGGRQVAAWVRESKLS